MSEALGLSTTVGALHNRSHNTIEATMVKLASPEGFVQPADTAVCAAERLAVLTQRQRSYSQSPRSWIAAAVNVALPTGQSIQSGHWLTAHELSAPASVPCS